MTAAELQQSLFQQVKERLPAHLSLAEEVAALLGVSADSAYRRIRGEKLMDIGELQLLARQHGISLDALLATPAGNRIFRGDFVGDGALTVTRWLEGMHDQLAQLASAPDPVFIFRAEDIPTFHYFQFPELTLFKLFFWRRTILDLPAFQNRRFDLTDKEDELLAAARRTHLAYLRLPSTEIWNADSLNAFLRQLAFYRDAGLFANERDADVLFDALLRLIDHLQAQAEAGVKFMIGEPATTGSAPFKVYVNEVMQGDNMIYAEAGGRAVVFINHSAINYVSTTDEGFCDFARRSIGTIMRRSVLVSGTGERERSRFFRSLREEVERRRAR